MEARTYLNRYRICTGSGGAPLVSKRSTTGTVYRAEEIATGELVALEVMPTYAFELDALQQFEAEAAAAQRLDHPNISRVHDFGHDGGDLVLVTEHLEGTRLDEWVETHGPLPAPAVLRIGLQTVSALGAAAFHAMVHSAIHPRNLMIVPGQTPDGEWPLVKLLNFGAVVPAFAPHDATPADEQFAAQFASPEQRAGQPVDFRSEMFSLGATLWFLLTGAAPADAAAVEQTNRVPKPLRSIIARMLALDPLERPQDPVALQEHLRECLAVVGPEEALTSRFAVAAPDAVVEPAPDLAPVERLRRRPFPWKPVTIAAIVIGMLLLLGVAVPAVFRLNPPAEKPIGVQIGVPEPAANAIAVAPVGVPEPDATVAAPSRNTAVASLGTPAPSIAAPTQDQEPSVGEAPAVVATTAATPAETSPENATAPAVAPAPTAAANAYAANATRSPAQAIPAEPEPPAPEPPAEGPDFVDPTSAPRPATASPRVASRDAAPRSSDEAENTRSRRKSTRPSSAARSSDRVASNTRRRERAQPEVRIAEPVDESELPALPPRGQRARFLGTTPEGDMIFGLPSDEEVFISPPPAEPRVRSPLRRVGRAIFDPFVRRFRPAPRRAEPVYEDELEEFDE